MPETTAPFYGEAPTPILDLDLSGAPRPGVKRAWSWHEFMHYLYLPVRIPAADPGLHAAMEGVVLPDRLAFLSEPVMAALADARATAPHLADPYLYVTARRGYATPGNPLNRPGWHTDDFGGTDLNYIWTDAFPTRFLLAERPLDISSHDQVSMEDMAAWAALADNAEAALGPDGLRIEDGPVNTLLRLTPHVIHTTPEIPGPGGVRSFFKISVSTHRYDLLGNSHNYGLDYDWPLYDRQALRNQPSAVRTEDHSGLAT